ELNVNHTPVSAGVLADLRRHRPETRVLARGRAMLGASVSPSGPCVLIGVPRDSAAAAAGLREGDCIVAADGNAIRELSDLTIAVYGHLPGESIELEFTRGGQKQKSQAVLEPRRTAKTTVR